MVIRKVLVIRFSSIGDIVLTTPVVRCLKRQWDAEVHYLTKSSFRPVLEANPYIDRLHTIGKDVREALPLLKEEKYDLVVDLHRNLRSGQVKRALGRPGVSFPKLNLEKWLLVRFKWQRMPGLHIVDRYMAPLRPFGLAYDGEGLDYFIPPEGETDPFSLAGGAEEPYIAFSIGAAHATKRLPAGQLEAICRSLTCPVFLLGGPSDREMGEQVAQNAGRHVYNLCGKLDINQSASVVRQAAAVISHDTGLMHIAAAFRKPIVSVWGNTVPAFGMYPFYPDGMDAGIVEEVQGLPCRPCSKIGFGSCPKGHFHCMTRQDTAQIAQNALSMAILD